MFDPMHRMAIAHFRSKIIGQGTSPVAAAAYRHRTKMHDETRGKSWRYRADPELVYAELALPADAPMWIKRLVEGHSTARASEALWNEVTAFETRFDAQSAREIVVALPLELTRSQNIALVQDYVATHVAAQGFAADWVFHDKLGNPHIHIMHTLRPLAIDGFGRKRIALLDDAGLPLRNDQGVIVYRHFTGSRGDFAALRQAWGETATRHLAAAGFDIAVDMRTYADRGIAIAPTTHRGPAVSALQRGSRPSDLTPALADETARRTAHLDRNPAHVLDLIADQQSTFTERDIARTLHRYIDDPAAFARIFDAAKSAPSLVLLRPAITDPITHREVTAPVYATRATVAIESRMADTALAMHTTYGFAVSRSTIAAAIRATESATTGRPIQLSQEQRNAVDHVTGDGQLACIVGLAGAGKSTLLDAARRAWIDTGVRVVGAALAGKAAAGLEGNSGIPSRTIASWLRAWSRGTHLLQKGEVFVLDEAGMVASKQLATIVEAVYAAGAKLVLVGDPQQLQPIEAGAAFRAIIERTGFAEVTEIRRQRAAWQQAATRSLACGDVAIGLSAYLAHGAVQTLETRSQAIDALVDDWTKARFAPEADANNGGGLLVLAHTNADVLDLNTALRIVLDERGALGASTAFATARGPRQFAVDDRVIFLENKSLPDPSGGPEVAVKNGMLGTVAVVSGDKLNVRLDAGACVTFDATAYANIDYGYAATIHKSQGATVDSVFVLAAPTMNRHMAYVAFSRHRDALTIYAPQDTFQHLTLQDALARSASKTTTLDFDASTFHRDAFCRRRGLDTLADWAAHHLHILKQKFATLSALWARATAAKVGLASAMPPSLKPELTPQIALAPYTPPGAGDAIAASSVWMHLMREARPLIDELYQDPASASAALARHCTSGNYPADATRAFEQSPDLFGRLATASWLFHRTPPSGRSHSTAVAALARSVRALSAHAQSALPGVRNAAAARQQESQVMIQDISVASFRVIDLSQKFLNSGDTKNFRRILSTSAANISMIAEWSRIDAALTDRFGRHALRKSRLGVSERARLEALVAPHERAKFQAILPTLVAIRDAHRFVAALQARARRRAAGHAPAAAGAFKKAKERPMSNISTGTENQIPDKFAYKTTIDANTALVAFAYDKPSNEAFVKAMKPTPVSFKDGAWVVPLSPDAAARDVQLTRLKIAETQIAPRMQALSNSDMLATEITRGHDNAMSTVELSVRNATLAVKIPPVQAAIDALKDVGAKWIPHNEDRGGYWRVAINDQPHKSRVVEAVANAGIAIEADSVNKSLATAMSSPHAEIRLSHASDKLFIDTPNMPAANNILKADGPGKATWDRSAGAYAVRVTSDNAADIEHRLTTVGDHFDKALVPPRQGQPGLEHPTEAQAKILAAATPEAYATDLDVRKVVDAMAQAFEKALSAPDREALLARQPGAEVNSERLRQMPEASLSAAAALVATVQQVQREGVKQQLALAQGQAQTKAQGIGQ